MQCLLSTVSSVKFIHIKTTQNSSLRLRHKDYNFLDMWIVELLSSISIIIASCVAIYGIGAWKREYRGKRQIELAEDALTLFYEAQNVIQAIRSPLGCQEEGTSRKPQKEETPAQKSARDSAYVVFERYQNRQELFNKIYSMRYRFMARFGLEAAKPFEDLRGIVNEIFGAARRLARLWATDISSLRSDEQENQHFEKQQKYQDIFWDTYSEDDPINPKLDQVILDIERVCKPIIMEKRGMVLSIKKFWSNKVKSKKGKI
jgi:hypothetical protein